MRGSRQVAINAAFNRNPHQHVFNVSKNFRISKADHPIPGGGDGGFALIISKFLANVRCAVEFDDQLLFLAYEVGDVLADWNLTPKLKIVKPAVSESVPQSFFRRRKIVAQLTSEGKRRGSEAMF